MVTIERVKHSGAYVVTALVSDSKACGTFYMSRAYYGHTKRDAVNLFKDYCRGNGVSIHAYSL